MNAKTILLTIAGLIIVVASYIFGRYFNRRSGSGTGPNTDPVRDGIKRAGDTNKQLAEAERRTADGLREQAETIERAGQDNRDAQQLVQRAKKILGSAKHNNSDS